MASKRRKGGQRAKRDAVEPYDVRFSIERCLAPSLEPEEYVLDIEAEVIHVTDTTEAIAGRVDACVVEADRANDDGEDIEMVCDDIGDGLEQLCGAVFDGDGWLREDVSDGGAGNDVLFLRNATVAREHRGARVGLAAVLRVIETFGRGCAVVVMEPFPLQLSSGRDRMLDVEGVEPDAALAQIRLERHWQKLGFSRLNGGPLFVLDLQKKRPTFADLFSG